MKEYICIKKMLIRLYKKDGMLLKDNYIELKVGSIWKIPNNLNNNLLNNINNTIMLKSENLGWTKLTTNNFKRHFKLNKKENKSISS